MCWETPEVLRFGFDRAELRLIAPSVAEQRFIHLLKDGIDALSLQHSAALAGLTEFESHNLLKRLSPVLTPRHQVTPPKASIAVLGQGVLADAVQRAAVQGGLTLSDPEHASFAVIIEHFLSPAARAHVLLINEVAHLPILLSDRSVSVGPLVMPGTSPCLSCIELDRLDDRPLGAVLAAQLSTTVIPFASKATLGVLAALALNECENWRAGTPSLAATRLRFDLQGGRLSPFMTVQTIAAHPRCGCTALEKHEQLAA